MSRMQAVISVFEHQVITLADFPITADFHWLASKVEEGQLPCFAITLQSAQLALATRHYLAVIRLPSGTILEILPKINKTAAITMAETRQWVGKMLADVYGNDFHIKQSPLPVLATAQTVESPRQQTWLEPIIEQWFQLLMKINLPRQYQQNLQNTPQAQGKLLIKQQLKHNAHRPHYRYTSQQQLSLNELWGQFFYTAMVKIQSLGLTTPQSVMQTLTALTQNSKPITIPITQQQASYHQLKQQLVTNRVQQDKHIQQQLAQALKLAWLILQIQDLSPSMPVLGQETTPAVMINMNQAFEKWITAKLNEKYPQRIQSQLQSTWLTNPEDLSEKRTLQPDILIQSDEKTMASIETVADIKYKSISSTQDVASSDLYQLFTYHQHWQATQAWLIFPKYEQKTACDLPPITLTTTNQAENLADFRVKLVFFDVKTANFLL